ncbi:flagellar hook-basal body complex protein FliE [Halobacillus salinarum]|uniref:Flagellar hook-basal body complex protein FliE n=2 Tax=Halobacillus salinarum TaxID=2932257 RepID=A0ABY4ES52_9BACI|nr:flagellar hook-basal body complex protein FliE [Halobacillus salinarum]
MKGMTSKAVSPSQAHSQFADSLKQAIDQLNHSQVESNQKTEALAKGEINDLHDVMISAQKASISMQTAVEVQNKVIDAYKEMMRMQV